MTALSFAQFGGPAVVARGGMAARAVMSADDIGRAFQIPRASHASEKFVARLARSGVTQGAATAVVTKDGVLRLGLSLNAAKGVDHIRVVTGEISKCFSRKTCGELEALSRAVMRGNPLEGAVSFTRGILTGAAKPACKEGCAAGLRTMGVIDGVL